MDTDRPRGTALLRLAGTGVAVIAILIFALSSTTYVNPGHVGIIIHRTGGGVDQTPYGPGLHLRNPLTTGIQEYPTFMQTLVLTKGGSEGSQNNDEINVNSVEGQPLSLDVSMSFELDPRMVPSLYTTFRADVATVEHTYVKQAIRQALQEVVGNEAIADIIGPKKAEVTVRVQTLHRPATQPVRYHREAIHDQRAACTTGRDRGHQPEERDAAAVTHRRERAAEEQVPGTGRLDQRRRARQGHSR